VAAFYRIWTCKEAYLKATGAGLSFPLGKFSVSAVPDELPGLLAVDGSPEEVSRWSFVTPDVGANFASALAVEGHGWTLMRREWTHGVATGMS
jgi:4'-phosphopantetheinyl transferase